MSNVFGEWLREQRMQRRWSQADLAERSGVNGVTISRTETGRTITCESTRAKLVAALGVDTEAVLPPAEPTPIRAVSSDPMGRNKRISQQLTREDRLGIIALWLTGEWRTKDIACEFCCRVEEVGAVVHLYFDLPRNLGRGRGFIDRAPLRAIFAERTGERIESPRHMPWGSLRRRLSVAS